MEPWDLSKREVDSEIYWAFSDHEQDRCYGYVRIDWSYHLNWPEYTMSFSCLHVEEICGKPSHVLQYELLDVNTNATTHVLMRESCKGWLLAWVFTKPKKLKLLINKGKATKWGYNFVLFWNLEKLRPHFVIFLINIYIRASTNTQRPI